MIVLIDNYDSFTYNLVQMMGELGHLPTVFRNDEISVAELKKLSPKAIILSPGPCTPNEAGICLETVKALQGKSAIFGVCLGHQTIAQAFGATIVRAKEAMHGKHSEILHNQGGVFSGMTNPIHAVRYHSLVVDPASLPSCLEVTAKTWGDEIMGLQVAELAGSSKPIEGVQFHPESIDTKEGIGLMASFLGRAIGS